MKLSSFITALFTSAIFSLIGGIVGIFINEASGFVYGYLICFAILFIFILFTMTNVDRTEKKLTGIDIDEIWESHSYDLNDASYALSQLSGLSQEASKIQIKRKLLNSVYPNQILSECEYEYKVALPKILEMTHLKEYDIKIDLMKIIKQHETNINASNKVKQKEEKFKNYTPPIKAPTNKQLYKENKKNGVVTCPKCGSSSITTTNKKLSATRGATGAIIGGALTGGIGAGVGAVAGGLSSKKIYNVCMNCGHKWKP